MKKTLSFIAALALAGSLAACGGGGVADTIVTKSPTTAETKATDDATTDDATTAAPEEETPTATEPGKEGETETKNGITKTEGGAIAPSNDGTPTKTKSLVTDGVEFEYSMPTGWMDAGGFDGVELDFGLVNPGQSTAQFTTNIVVVKSLAQHLTTQDWNDDYGYILSPGLGFDAFTKYTVGDMVVYSGTREFNGNQLTQTFAVLVKDDVLYELVMTTQPGQTKALLPQFAEFITSIK